MATKSTKSTSRKTESESRRTIKLPQGWFDLQKRVLEGQHSAFEATFKTVSSLQENRDKAVHSFLESSSFVPKEVRQVAETWMEIAKENRETFKGAVDQSYELMTQYVDRLGESRSSAKA